MRLLLRSKGKGLGGTAMARPKENSKRTYVFLSDEDFAALDKQAKVEGSTVSAILRRLAKRYIADIARVESVADEVFSSVRVTE